MINYVLGFLFSEDRTKICLILKNKPDFLAGKYNGIGGKIEPGEDASEAIVREFKEETGVTIPDNKWHYLATMNQTNWRVYVYRAFSDVGMANVRTMEEEEIGVYDVNTVLREMNIPHNLHWLITFALDSAVDYMNADYL
jgi:8-oxo-dGTP diphosphatase